MLQPGPPPLPGYIPIIIDPAKNRPKPQFYGGDPKQCLNWMRQFQNYIQGQILSDEEKITTCCSYLKDDAQTWVSTLTPDQRLLPWSQFLILFRDNFIAPGEHQRLVVEIPQMFKRPNETIPEFGKRFTNAVAMANELDPAPQPYFNDRQLLQIYLNGLPQDCHLHIITSARL